MSGKIYPFLETSEAEADLLFVTALQEPARIGYLRGDFGRGSAFWTTWFEGRQELKDQAFRDELDELVNALRENGPLKDLAAMRSFCLEHPQAKMSDSRGFYAFRIDTARHRYFLRFFPEKLDYNFYIFCYRAELLQKDLPEPNYSPCYGPNADRRVEASKRRRSHER